MGNNLETYEIDLDDLLNATSKDMLDSKNKDFEDVLNLDININREIYIGDISGNTGYEVDNIIRFWNRYDEQHNIPVEERKHIKLIVDSWGGSLTDAFSIIDSIQLSKTPIEAIVIGCAYSAGFFITISCPIRKAYKHASFLFHEGSTGTSGTANQFANFAIFYKRQLNQLKDVVLSKTKITEEKYNEIQKDDYWMDVQDALEWGCIDEVL